MDTVDCIFCAIAAKQAPASVVFEDEVCLAFMDLYPMVPGHLLVVPKTHAASLSELDEATGMHLFRIAQRMAAAVRGSGLRCEGINLFLPDGEAAGSDALQIPCLIGEVHRRPRERDRHVGIQLQCRAGLRCGEEREEHVAVRFEREDPGRSGGGKVANATLDVGIVGMEREVEVPLRILHDEAA